MKGNKIGLNIGLSYTQRGSELTLGQGYQNFKINIKKITGQVESIIPKFSDPIGNDNKAQMTKFHPNENSSKHLQDDENSFCFSSLDFAMYASYIFTEQATTKIIQ